MANFSEFSTKNLSEAVSPLKALFTEVIKEFDCRVLCGYRNEEDQTKAFMDGNSTKKYPDSKHNKIRSRAVDVAPYPVDWQDIERFYLFGGYVLGVADQMGIGIRWGGDWDMDTDVHDQKLMDLVHFELTGV